jgi:hypothetical protein
MIQEELYHQNKRLLNKFSQTKSRDVYQLWYKCTLLAKQVESMVGLVEI